MSQQPVWPGLIAAYRDSIAGASALDPASIVTLYEGATPLIYAPSLSEQVQAAVYIKVEGQNPTGSFKDRGMTMAVSHAKNSGQEAVLCASTGNTSASAAAYAARGGLTCAVLIPVGKIAAGKLAQAVMYGAKIVQIEGNFDDCLEIARKTTAEHDHIALVNSVNPVRIEGQKTAAFEIIENLGDAPDLHILPVGNAGNITAYWRGYQQYHQAGKSTKLPRMIGMQAAGAAPFIAGAPIKNPDTIATAIRIGAPASWSAAIEAQTASGGFFAAVTDERIVAAQRQLAADEGIFVEPASAASIAGLLQANKAGTIPANSTIVCTVTGNGLKDPAAALDSLPEITPIAAESHAVIAALGL